MAKAKKIKSPAGRTQLVDAMVNTFRAHAVQVREQLEKLVPPGTRVSWITKRAGKVYEHYGRVLWGCHDVGRFRVLNDATGKESEQGFGRHGNLRVEG